MLEVLVSENPHQYVLDLVRFRYLSFKTLPRVKVMLYG